MEESIAGEHVVFEDHTLRDGFQIEPRIFSTDEKLHLFEMLKHSGISRVQIASFVNPKIVPQMADSEALVRAVGNSRMPAVSALVLNERGLSRAIDSGVRRVSLSASVSDTHNRKNAKVSAADGQRAVARMVRRSLDEGIEVRAGLQCVFGCVYEGAIAPDAVLTAAERMIDAGAPEINLADTTGMATPLAVRQMVRLFHDRWPDVRVALHLHDQRGLALANMFAGYEEGVRFFDACIGGLGGCPFVQGAAGNVALEDAVNMFEAMGVTTGIDMVSVCEAVAFLEAVLQRSLPGRMRRVLASGTWNPE